jgi:hypothetical protein
MPTPEMVGSSESGRYGRSVVIGTGCISAGVVVSADEDRRQGSIASGYSADEVHKIEAIGLVGQPEGLLAVRDESELREAAVEIRLRGVVPSRPHAATSIDEREHVFVELAKHIPSASVTPS